MASRQRLYWALDYFNNKISILYNVSSKYRLQHTFAQLSSKQMRVFMFGYFFMFTVYKEVHGTHNDTAVGCHS